jgi:hypothetical protein
MLLLYPGELYRLLGASSFNIYFTVNSFIGEIFNIKKIEFNVKPTAVTMVTEENINYILVKLCITWLWIVRVEHLYEGKVIITVGI